MGNLKSLLTAREVADIDDVARRLAAMSAQLSRITGFDPGEDPRDSTIKELMEALEPMADAASEYAMWSEKEENNVSCWTCGQKKITVGQLRKSAAALSRAKSLMEQKP